MNSNKYASIWTGKKNQIWLNLNDFKNQKYWHASSLVPFSSVSDNERSISLILNKNKGPELFPFTFFFEVREDLL